MKSVSSLAKKSMKSLLGLLSDTFIALPKPRTVEHWTYLHDNLGKMYNFTETIPPTEEAIFDFIRTQWDVVERVQNLLKKKKVRDAMEFGPLSHVPKEVLEAIKLDISDCDRVAMWASVNLRELGNFNAFEDFVRLQVRRIIGRDEGVDQSTCTAFAHSLTVAHTTLECIQL